MLSADWEESGFTLRREAVSSKDIRALRAALAMAEGGAASVRGDAVYAQRNVLENDAAALWATGEDAAREVVPVLGAGAFAVRGLLFDKVPGANWRVPVHQDVSIAVTARRESAGFGPWSEKAGVVHVQPPAEVLGRIVTLRLHLDDCPEDNGPLLVFPGSHRFGKMTAAQIQAWREGNKPQAVTARAGDLLVMRPLLLHASGPSVSPEHRRVLHVEYAVGDLPDGLEWHTRLSLQRA